MTMWKGGGFARLYRRAVIALARPYIRRELPGWGRIYRTFVGSHKRDWLWAGEHERWVTGKLHGFEMSVRIEGWSNRATFFLERFYDLPTQLLMKRLLRDGDVFVDVGANEGMMTLLGAHLVGPTGLVVSFEPNPGPRAILERNLVKNAISNVEVHGSGLSDVPGHLQLFVPCVNSGESSFTPPDDPLAGKYVRSSVRVGDDAMGGRCPKLIKIDVEGFEAHVLRGLTRTLQTCRPVVVLELIARHLARDEMSPARLCAWLAAHGYEGRRLSLSGRSGLQMDPMPAHWEDGDYVFAHRDCPV